MKKLLLLSSLFALGLVVNAQVTPKVQPETVVDGGKYVLVNKAQKTSQYMSRTSWDGALYFLGKIDSNYANYALTAVKNDDGTWSFTLLGGVNSDDEEPVTYYMLLPDGSTNVNVTSTEVAKWSLDPKEGGFYHIILGDEGNNGAALAKAPYTPTKDLRMHLNAGGEFFVVTYDEGPYFPDCLGGIKQTFDESANINYFEAEDSTSFNWGFLSVDKVPDYYTDLEYVGTINKFYEDYCDMDGYSEGFLATYNAVAKLYNDAEDADMLVEAGILEIINAKIALYNEIEAAIMLNEDDDATLAAAISAAQSAFDTLTAVEDVANATKTLKEAEANYSLGNGDITPLGTNMSFEDLSAQGGNTTTGIAGAPAGWNVYINGNQVVTADDVKQAGIANWHGVNNESDGEAKDGNYAFGIWTAAVPTYEISQTIEGLETGTYEVAAGLMAGSNGSGSRLTTQRIFGNLNSTYYASEYDYDLNELDKTEVYAFADNEVFQTDTELRPVTVKAFVYDGTLTFGLRTDGNFAATSRTSGNSAGGDGWFKLDNFRITKLGYNADDAIAMVDHYKSVLKDYKSENMAAQVKAQIDDKVAALDGITSSSSTDDIVKGIVEAKDFIAPVAASVKAYAKLREAIDRHFDYLDLYEKKAGAGDYADAIYAAEEAWADGSAEDEAAVDAIIAGLDVALEECIQSDEITEGADLTEYIKNPSFEDLSSQDGMTSGSVANTPKGWNLYVNGTLCETASDTRSALSPNWCAINGGDPIGTIEWNGNVYDKQPTDGDYLFGIWAATMEDVELSQVLKNMPAGQYTVTADVMVIAENYAPNNLTTQRIFANDYVAMWGDEESYVDAENFTTDMKIAQEMDELSPDATVKHFTYAGNYNEPGVTYDYTYVLRPVTLTFGLAEQGDIKIGFRTNGVNTNGNKFGDEEGTTYNGQGWFKLDNWTLTIDSFEVPAGAELTPEATGIEEVQGAEKVTAEFYSLSGARLAAPQKGINIVKKSDGTSVKVFVK